MADNQNTQRRRETEEKLISAGRMTKEEIFAQYGTGENGLDPISAAECLEEYGRNIIDAGSENRLLSRIREAVINPFNIVLIVVALVTLVTDVIMADVPNWATFIMLAAVIVISGVISFVQSEKSNNAARKLQKMITNRIDVVRNGSVIEIGIDEAVPGDVVRLASGDMIPGDVRLIEAKDLFIDQSQLTGKASPWKNSPPRTRRTAT